MGNEASAATILKASKFGIEDQLEQADSNQRKLSDDLGPMIISDCQVPENFTGEKAEENKESSQIRSSLKEPHSNSINIHPNLDISGNEESLSEAFKIEKRPSFTFHSGIIYEGE